MSVSTLRVVPEIPVSGTAPGPEPLTLSLLSRSWNARDQILARTSTEDYWDWLHHVTPAGGCARPIRLAGQILTMEADTGRRLSKLDTSILPDGILYKACGNRRASVCPSCSRVYQRDAYQLIRAGLVGGKGVPAHVATHPAVFATFTAPGFGPVHTRHVPRHTCTNRRRCDCRPEPCHPRRESPTCPHGRPVVCFARHDPDDPRLGTPMWLDRYDHDAQAVFNDQAGELWRRSIITATGHLRRLARRRGLHPETVKLSIGKVAEMQRRAAVHYHAVIRLDGTLPYDQSAVLPCPPQLGIADA